MLNNPYTRIAIASALSTLISPSITNKLTVVEDESGIRNDLTYYGVAGATTAFVYVLLAMAVGPAKAA